MKRRTTLKGLERGTFITVANDGGRRRYGRVTKPTFVSAHGHVGVEYREAVTGAIRFAKVEDVRIDRALETRRRREQRKRDSFVDALEVLFNA